MDTAPEKVTPRQRHRLNQLLLSSEKIFARSPPPNGKSTANNPPETTPVPAPVRKEEQETKIYRINGVDYTDKNEAAAAASKAIFG